MSHDGGVDGRTARRDRNRVAVLDAMIELFSEDIDPGPDEVAQRSGLSPRSVYRYFEDRDELLRAAITRQLELVSPLYLLHAIGEGSLEKRVDGFVSARLRLHATVADTARAARHRAGSNDTIRQQVLNGQRVLREQVARQFEPELSQMPARVRRARLGAIDTLTQFESLDYLRSAYGPSASSVRAVLSEALFDLLDGPRLVDEAD